MHCERDVCLWVVHWSRFCSRLFTLIHKEENWKWLSQRHKKKTECKIQETQMTTTTKDWVKDASEKNSSEKKTQLLQINRWLQTYSNLTLHVGMPQHMPNSLVNIFFILSSVLFHSLLAGLLTYSLYLLACLLVCLHAIAALSKMQKCQEYALNWEE